MREILFEWKCITLLSSYVADMHTHSENSHDSQCKIEDMCMSQMHKGTGIMAVTDHIDIFRYHEQNIFTPVESSFNAVNEMNKKYKDKIMLLSGMELGEGFWNLELSKKIIDFLPYDVIIGSVHCVKYRDLLKPSSEIDFSCLSQEIIDGYISKYFDDIITMIKTVDFDILAHLTYPLRYICGKYKKEVNLSQFHKKIKHIFDLIIKKILHLK